MQRVVSAVLKITDQFTRRPVSAHPFRFAVDEELFKPIYKPGGYFVFTDLSHGIHKITMESQIYENRTINVVVSENAAEYEMLHFMLNPSPAYPFNITVTSICGCLCDNEKPLSNQPFCLLTGKEAIKIAQDDADAGCGLLKLFVATAHGRLSVPSLLFIQDKKQEQQEFCVLTSRDENTRAYKLEQKLRFSHIRGTLLLEAIEYRTDLSGNFFAAFTMPPIKEASIDFILPQDGKNKIFSVHVVSGKMNNVGMIRIGA